MWDCRNITAKSGVVHLVEDDAEESGSLVTWIRLELGMNQDNESGGHRGEQASLSRGSASVRLRK